MTQSFSSLLFALSLSVYGGQRLHPLLSKVGNLVKDVRSDLTDLQLLVLDPDLKEIYGDLNNENIVIVNEFHKARAFRKVHLEIAFVGSSLQILHCVFFPKTSFDLPIFGVDLVISTEGVSAAIVDLSPVGNKLPDRFISELETLRIHKYRNVRQLPSWGNIFSPYVCFIKPADQKEEDSFFELVNNYLKLLVSIASTTTADPPNSSESLERYKRQSLYCLNQKKNDKTRNLLGQIFDSAWADRYIEFVLFDTPPAPC